MNNQLQQNYYIPAATVEEDFVNLVKLELSDIRNTFFKIGFRLREANVNRYYKKLGFNSIEECAEMLFGFKKTTTYDLMNVALSFADRQAPMMLDSKYSQFSQSQLVLFASINYGRDGFIRRVRPEDTIDKLKRAKKYWKEIQVGKFCRLDYRNCKTIDEVIELVENYIAQNEASKTQENSGYLEKSNSELNSGYPEKSSKGNIVLDVPADQIKSVVDVPDDQKSSILSEEKCSTLSKEAIITEISKRLVHMSYKTIFDPEDKGLGIRVPPESIVKFILDSFAEITERENLSKTLMNEWR